MTDNSSVDAAASWVLDNQHLPDIDQPFQLDDNIPALEAHPFERTFPLDEKTMNSPYKMVFVVNTELNMGVGKIAAQVGHAAGNQDCMKGENSAHLFDVEDLAQKAHIPHYLVHDAGKTQSSWVCRPSFLFPSGFHLRAVTQWCCLGMILSTCPSHFHLLFFTSVLIV
ncbi:hypothetical protein OS493_038276 [Desmophyllum pertusum]|uniref:peptidyl-tRNA hydrolase n=1 Tax=Desmophyllum pertusum TaxID=174260 RepID=A0A9W9ZV74_9CNID|nr:hypothetical protein OS493_038276 [Desmophyllum pertusum]